MNSNNPVASPQQHQQPNINLNASSTAVPVRKTTNVQKPIVIGQPSAKTTVRKRSPSTAARAKAKNSGVIVVPPQVAYERHPELKDQDILWINPEPGYGTPKNLSEMEDNTGKVFVRWLSWEKDDHIGYTLFDENEVKWWADAASVHILSRAQGYKISYNSFSFIVKRENRIFTYGFWPKAYAQEAQLRCFAEFGKEMNGEEPPRVQYKTLAQITAEDRHPQHQQRNRRVTVVQPVPQNQQQQEVEEEFEVEDIEFEDDSEVKSENIQPSNGEEN